MVKILILTIAFSAFCFSQSIPIPQIEFSPKKYICYHSSEPIIVDGKLSESAWTKAEWTDNFVDIEGSIKPLPRFRTRVKMLWDEKYFYIAAELQEPDIWGTLKNHDDIIFYDNDFEIFIDPDGDTRDYSEFEMNALNTVWDLLLEMPYRDIDKAAKDGWNIKGLKTGVSICGSVNKTDDKDSCWTVEVAFPWGGFTEITSMPTPPKDNDQWRINFSRVEWKTETKNGTYQKQINPETNKPYPEDNWVWSPQGVVNMHYPEMWGYVQFSQEIVGSKKASFVEKSEETAKWFLRQIYYRERNYIAKNETYTNDLKKLEIEVYPIPGYIMLPVIECTTHMFEASLQSVDGTLKIYIRNDGLTWISHEKK
jgi:hypothetical protein